MTWTIFMHPAWAFPLPDDFKVVLMPEVLPFKPPDSFSVTIRSDALSRDANALALAMAVARRHVPAPEDRPGPAMTCTTASART